MPPCITPGHCLRFLQTYLLFSDHSHWLNETSLHPEIRPVLLPRFTAELHPDVGGILHPALKLRYSLHINQAYSLPSKPLTCCHQRKLPPAVIAIVRSRIKVSLQPEVRSHVLSAFKSEYLLRLDPLNLLLSGTTYLLHSREIYILR